MSKKKSAFQKAVEATDEIKNCWKPGLQALGSYSTKIKLGDKEVCGSVDLDGCLAGQKLYPSENRWDYAVCYNGKVYFVEVHSAESSEVEVVRNKQSWLTNWLNSKAPELVKLKASGPNHWVQSGRMNIPKESRHYRKAVQMKLIPKPSLVLS